MLPKARLKTVFEFEDPSGTIASPKTPLNQWVQVDVGSFVAKDGCSDVKLFENGAIIQDMLDGEYKKVWIKDGVMTVHPHMPNQSWGPVTGTFNMTTCSALIELRVPGKPNPPPVGPLKVTVEAMNSRSNTDHPANLEFTDPWDKLGLGSTTFPMNRWVMMPKEFHRDVLV